MSSETFAHATDMDVTFILPSDREHPESQTHRNYLANLETLRILTPAIESQEDLRWGDASGREPDHIERARRQHANVGAPLPKAAFTIARAGAFAEVRDQQTDRFVPLPNWPPRATIECWSIPRVSGIMNNVIDCASPGGVSHQELGNQSEFKRSYYVSETFARWLGEAGIEDFLTDIEASLRHVGVEATILFSSIAGKPDRFLDIMAKGVHKGAAYAAVCDYFGIPFENRSCSVDSGNDYELAVASHNVIAVPNGEPAFLSRLADTFEETPERLYIPQGISAAGVREGLVRLGRVSA